MSTCPYDAYPDASFWRRAVSRLDCSSVDPMGNASIKITPETKIATAGSCFAQNIACCLNNCGFTYFVTEDCPAFIPDHIARRHGYRVFSARYGNIYTLRQLVQLIQRSYCEFVPVDIVWEISGRYVDPFRPLIQPNGFPNAARFLQDRTQHFAAVRRLIETSDVFVFTLGLTEAWMDKRDGAVFPVCPGCGTGTFDEHHHQYYNFDYEESLADGRKFIELVRARNPNLKIVLTVSPVPLVATASSSHVLSASTYSKSILRAIAGKLSSLFEDVVYFPSYEIITGAFNRGSYFKDDLRSVTEAGINHVMSSFFKNFAGTEYNPTAERKKAGLSLDERKSLDRIRLICDEEVLDRRLLEPR